MAVYANDIKTYNLDNSSLSEIIISMLILGASGWQVVSMTFNPSDPRQLFIAIVKQIS